MTRAARRALVPAALCAALVLPGVGSAAVGPGGTAVRAVVTLSSSGLALPGVDVVHRLTALDAAVVEGTPAALTALRGVPGVRGVALDAPLTVTSARGSSDTPGVLAPAGLGRPAGSPKAGRGVRVAVVDTGVSDTEALARTGRNARLVDGVDTSDPDRIRTTGTFEDGHGHGTHMATLVAGSAVPATRGKALGVAPGATVVVVKVAGADGSTSLSRVLAGLDWVASHPEQVDVLSLALAHTRPGETYGLDPLIDAVARVRAAGIPAVVASGNTAETVADPGFDPRGLSVGAADLTDRRPVVAPFSGSDVVDGVRRPDVVANGVGLLALVPPGSVIDEATPARQDGLTRGSGTSQATAVVAGVVALMLQDHPDATPDQVRASLRVLARDLPGERDGAGLLRLPHSPVAATDLDDVAVPHPGGPTSVDGHDDPWAASSWGVSSWGASSWGASSWGASSWGASSWGASSWGASSWGASSWGASSWGASFWGDDA